MWVFWVFAILAAILFGGKYIYKLQWGKCNSPNRLDGKLVIVTGASAGIGVPTALDMARRGARVIMACRNLVKAQKVADDIIRATGNTSVTVKKLDLASLASVRAFANDILRTEKALHILINNAGIAGSVAKQITEDGLELTMQANHFGHFLLTNMLGGLLKAGAPSRIVSVASVGHAYLPKLDLDDLNFSTTPYSGLNAYYLSKLCNVLMAREIANRLNGTGVTSYSLHPGAVPTEITHKNSSGLALDILFRVLQFGGKSLEAGAQTTIYCAVDDAAAHQSGLYYTDCKVVAPSAEGQHDGLAAKLWAASEACVKLQPHEANI